MRERWIHTIFSWYQVWRAQEGAEYMSVASIPRFEKEHQGLCSYVLSHAAQQMFFHFRISLSVSAGLDNTRREAVQQYAYSRVNMEWEQGSILNRYFVHNVIRQHEPTKYSTGLGILVWRSYSLGGGTENLLYYFIWKRMNFILGTLYKSFTEKIHTNISEKATLTVVV